MDNKLRLRFSKTGKAKYISHLDLIATIRRALLRCGIELRYSEGFNPHPYMSVALPLSVGSGSICELIDIGVQDDFMQTIPASLPELISDTLPEGLEVLELYKPERKFNKIAWIEISGTMFYSKKKPVNLVEKLSERYLEDKLLINKRSKHGLTEFDAAPFIRDISFTEDENILVNVKVSAQNPTINTENVLSVLDGNYSELAPDFSLFTRIEIFDDELLVFR